MVQISSWGLRMRVTYSRSDMERLSKYVGNFCDSFLKTYSGRILQYEELYREYPKCFSLKDNIAFQFLFLPHDVFCVIYRSQSYRYDFTFHYAEDEEIINFYKPNSPEIMKEKQMKEWIGDKEVLEFIREHFVNENEIIRCAENSARNLADKHAANALEEKQLFDILNFKSVITTINDKQFTYEMSEALQCFKSELYFASVVTGCVAFETRLVIFIKSKWGQVGNITNLEKLIKTIRDKGLISSSRTLVKLDNLKKLRNSYSHSNYGEVSKTDAVLVFNLIREICDVLH